MRWFLAALMICVGLICVPANAEEPEQGIASTYANNDGHQWTRTANGEWVNPKKLTAAHPKLPFGTRVRVTNKHNHKSVVVRINDRGPFKRGRIIDLTPAAANAIGSSGLAHVTVAPLVEKARAYIGQTASQVGVRRTLWCSAFLRAITNAAGVDDRAKSWLAKPRTAPHVGAIAVLSRGRGGGHVGVVSGFDTKGNPRIISGNHGHRVGESIYPRSRVIAYVSAG